MEAGDAPDLTARARRFAFAGEFSSSPLYRALGTVVANDVSLLRLASRARAGQYPTFLFFAAVQYLLLAGAEHDLARFYPSIAGADALPPEGAGPAFVSFCATFEPELTALLSTRLVQTNNVKRSMALRLGLAAIGRRVVSPVHLIEIGASAGVHLRCDRYGYHLGGCHFGDPRSPVQISSVWRGDRAVLDLDALPPLASVTGVDLHPLDATDVDDRRWLEALVWPENRHEADLLHRALGVVAADPPPIRAGDAIDVCPALAAELPAGEPRVVFLAATRLHVPADRRDAFNAAIESLGRTAPLYRVILEGPDDRSRAESLSHEGTLDLRSPDGSLAHLAIVDGHLESVKPLNL
jgi:hypothetical protein